MKKMYFLVVLCVATICLSAQNADPYFYPKWLQDLQNQNTGLIDSVATYPVHSSAPDYRTHVIYYHQPLDHANPQGVSFPMRAIITVNTKNDPRNVINHVYCTGYALDQVYANQPDSTYAAEVENINEICRRYNGNFIMIEHRYFQFSAPSACWTNLDYLTAEAAATDFHNLFTGMKKVLKGKWVMSGVSKGGITTLLQHTFYPNDMDIYAPYSAPFFESDRQLGMQSHWNNVGWSKEFLDIFMNVRKSCMTGLLDYPGQPSTNKIYPIYYFMNIGKDTTQAHRDSVYLNYLSNAAYFGFVEKAYSDTTKIRRQITVNDSIIRSYGWNGYNDTVLAYMMHTCSFQLNSIKPFIDTLRKYSQMPNQVPMRPLKRQIYDPFGVTEQNWWGTDTAHTGYAEAYAYQSKRELGFFDIRFDEIASTPQEAAVFNQFWIDKASCMRDFISPYYASLSFSPALYNRVMDATKNATKPIILLYGNNDPWTGAAVKDEYLSSSVKKYVLPNQNHLVYFQSNTDVTKCNEIRTILDGILGSPQGIEEVRDNSQFTIHNSQLESTKVLRDGQIYIMRGGKMYTLQGQEVK